MYKKIALQSAPFNFADELRAMTAATTHLQGAMVTFTGAVRTDGGVKELFIEHYPGMTEQALAHIGALATERWPLQALVLIHRIGHLVAGEDIVLVVTTARHRQAAYTANTFLMDYLKTEIPLWKKEIGQQFARWVGSSAHDRSAMRAWSN